MRFRICDSFVAHAGEEACGWAEGGYRGHEKHTLLWRRILRMRNIVLNAAPRMGTADKFLMQVDVETK